MKQGWEIKTLLDVSVSIEDGDWIEKKDQSSSGVRLIQTGNVGQGYYKDKGEKAKYISEDTFVRLKCTELTIGDILVSRLPDPVGRACILPALGVRCITAVDCSIIKLKQDIIHSQWFVYYSLSSEYAAKVNKECSGTTRDRISRKKLSCITIPIPPLAEQERIVEILDREFEKINALKTNTERSLQHAKDLFQSALKQELQPKEGWITASLNDLYDVRDGTHDSPQYIADGFPLVTSKNLRNGIVDISNVKYISRKDYDKINERSKVNIGDVLFAMIGTIGNPTLVIEEPNYAIKNMALFKVPHTQSGAFLKYILSSSTVLQKMLNKSKGSNQPFVSLGYLRRFEITIPSTLKEQEEIVKNINQLNDNCKALEANYTKTITLCDDMKQALLRKAFNGEL